MGSSHAASGKIMCHKFGDRGKKLRDRIPSRVASYPSCLVKQAEPEVSDKARIFYKATG